MPGQVRRVLRRLFLDKIAAVDKPCQEHATMAIMKRAPNAELAKVDRAAFIAAVTPAIAKALPALSESGSAAFVALLAKDVGAGDPDSGAVLFDSALASKEVTQEFQTQFWEATDTLRESICSILCDAGVDHDKLVAETLSQFSDHIQGIVPEEMEKALAAGFAAEAGAARIEQGNTMFEELKKKLGLPATATEAEVMKAVDDKEKADKKAGGEGKIEKMSDAHSNFMGAKGAKMPEGGKDAFQAMSVAERDKHISAHPVEKAGDDENVEKSIEKGEAFKTEGGVVIFKRDYNSPAAYDLAKSQATETADLKKRLAKRDEENEIASFAKRATDLGFADTFGETMRKAFKGGDADAIGKIEAEFKALREQVRVGKLFEEQGGGGTAVLSKGFDQIKAKADELKKADPKLTDEQAFAKAYEDPANKESVALYKRDMSGATA